MGQGDDLPLPVGEGSEAGDSDEAPRSNFWLRILWVWGGGRFWFSQCLLNGAGWVLLAPTASGVKVRVLEGEEPSTRARAHVAKKDNMVVHVSLS